MTTEASCGSEHCLGFDNFAIWEQLRLLCIRLQPVITGEHKAVNATWAAVSYRQGGNWFLWVKRSIRTLKISGLCKSLSYMVFGSLELLFRGESSKTFRHADLMGLKGTLLTLWDLSFWVWFPPGDDASFISCVLQLQAQDKKHFQCVLFHQLPKWSQGSNIWGLSKDYTTLHRYVCVCACIHVHSVSLVTFSVPFWLC